MGTTRELRQSDPARGQFAGGIPGVDARHLEKRSPHRARAIEAVRSACLNTGFFSLDHALCDPDVYADVLSRMRGFFSLPDDDPRKSAIDVTGQENTNGWMPMFQEPAYQAGTRAHLESFDCGRAARGPDDAAYRANRWPEIAGFRDDVQRLWTGLSDAGWLALEAIAQAMGLEEDFLVRRCDSQDLSTMRLLHYPPVDSVNSENADVGIAAHTDFECITFILQTAPGLELTDRNGDWYDAPAGPERIVVLLGDMLERWTNGAVQATGHRVRSREFERYSIVLFFAVNDGVTVAPLPQFVAANHPRRYEPTDQRSHTRAELERAEALRDEHREPSA